MRGKIIVASLLLCAAAPTFAQWTNVEPETNHFGVTFGYHHSMMCVSKIDKELFPKKTGLDSGVFTLFYQHAFGKNQELVIRPELGFVNRGGGYKNIYSNYWDNVEFDGIKDITYNVKGQYFDIRVPVMYQFLTSSSPIRPYVYLSPVLGFCYKGSIAGEAQYYLPNSNQGYTYAGMNLDATKANTNPVYFAGMVGVGANWDFVIDQNPFFLGLELSYEYGFTNTFGNDMNAQNKYSFDYVQRDAANNGSRRYSGIELKLTLGIPFSVFRKKEQPIIIELPDSVEENFVVEEIAEEEPCKSCYTLEEINSLMQNGSSVEGKTICAIDDAINFEFGKSEIKPTSYDYLNRLAETLIRTNAKIKVKGHTDNVGSDEFNMNLSRERAMKVVDYLLKRGVKRAKLSYDYYGSTCPLTTNDTEEGRMMNRRVEFEILN